MSYWSLYDIFVRKCILYHRIFISSTITCILSYMHYAITKVNKLHSTYSFFKYTLYKWKKDSSILIKVVAKACLHNIDSLILRHIYSFNSIFVRNKYFCFRYLIFNYKFVNICMLYNFILTSSIRQFLFKSLKIGL